MRKFVKPADPAATIPDPSRAGFLPPQGLPVEWSAHWARLALRGDIVVTEIEDEKPADPVPEPAPEPEPAAAVEAATAPDPAAPEGADAPPADAPPVRQGRART